MGKSDSESAIDKSDCKAPFPRGSILTRLARVYTAWRSELWKEDRWQPGYGEVYAQHRIWAGAKKITACCSWLVLASVLLSVFTNKLPFVVIKASDGNIISVAAGKTCLSETECFATPYFAYMTSSQLGGQSVPESARYLGFVMVLHVLAAPLISSVVEIGACTRSPYWKMSERQRAQKIAGIRIPVIPALAGALYTTALALIDLAYVDIIDGAESKLARAVPFAAIGMVVWCGLQWHIVRQQDRLWTSTRPEDKIAEEF